MLLTKFEPSQSLCELKRNNKNQRKKRGKHFNNKKKIRKGSWMKGPHMRNHPNKMTDSMNIRLFLNMKKYRYIDSELIE